MDMFRTARILILVGVASAAPLFALRPQADTSARLGGNAISAYNGRPLALVMIAVPTAGKSVVTDSTGRFLLTGLEPGEQIVHVSFEGQEILDRPFSLRPGKTTRIAVVLDSNAAELSPLVVEARLVDVWRDLAGFYARRKRYDGFGHFFTREDIERARSKSLSTLLGGEGIFTWCLYGCQPTRFSHGRICNMPITLDGLPIWDYNYDKIPMANVAAVEVYREGFGEDPFGVPNMGQLQLAGSSLLPRRGTCGSVGIWTR
ncbi:MAG: hypothetical protein DMD54_08165 [Gemmatimonadetes bacterium]|nr:MAG: hypothetical protein DMD54_08165 [Gemmatimonadota bacterium]